MASHYGEHAIEDALKHGRAVLKFISANDVGKTGAHQYGFYIPKTAAPLLTPHPPIKGRIDKSWPKVIWQDGRTTDSCVTWYGDKSRSEYRLTRFQDDFPYLNEDSIGSLLIIVPVSFDEFHAYILDLEEDIEDVQAALNTPVVGRFAVFDASGGVVETENACIDRKFRAYVQTLTDYPTTKVVSAMTRQFIAECVRGFALKSTDDQLFRWIKDEYRLFQMMERQLKQEDVVRTFKDIDDFLETASSIMQARKSRAGWSLENHVEFLFTQAGIPFQVRQKVDKTKPDVLIPSKAAYDDPNYPREKLVMAGLKTTCKDRWRQVLKEAPKIPTKHIITMQVGITTTQLDEMQEAGVVLVVPAPLHKEYPKDHPIQLQTVEQFITKVRGLHGG